MKAPEVDTDNAFDSAEEVSDALRTVGYLADPRIAQAVHLGYRLQKPVLVEGPAGTGKTELAKSIALATNSRLIRLQCYEGLDESKALYEWDYRKQLLHLQSHGQQESESIPIESERNLFDERFLLTRPLLEAIRSTDSVVLLIDEVDRIDVQTEALLLELLSDYQVSIPELGTVTATRIPAVFLTSNNSRDLSDALKRRCLYLNIDYPSAERERDIIAARVPGISLELADAVSEVVRSLRSMNLSKKPSISETLDWARTLTILNVDQVNADILVDTLPVLLKNQADIVLAAKELAETPR
ncbi:ATPase [Rhodococcus sp. ACPA4]|uniref:AAA family ATPase n=1 Tax=unclassified Rhodococcus (in: high G+C Gram-positive bacteria) TaxID=192944 RepID=UPI000BB123B4|nr:MULTISPECIES: MoxR family ATPase [unclassified Rhodococcus (in: high G+C Gram-positive bacteria)]MDJ0105400.1 MoxR family ATPase [Rhodococcus erythropolis]PBC43121.1 ATPase [Rhodococcus sp. ACPA4]RZL22135.1 MAG: MoxR family ATPase [Rhodococcus sp. (in: high G+C Gram-positive bacteria)]